MCNHYFHKIYYVTVKKELHYDSNVIKVLEMEYHMTSFHVHTYSYAFAVRELPLSITRRIMAQSFMKQYYENSVIQCLEQNHYKVVIKKT